MRRTVSIVAAVSLAWGCHGDSVGDAPSHEDAGGEGALDAGMNIVTDPDFEDPSCSMWSGGGEATTSEVDGIAHSGSKSCMVCGVDPHAVWGIGQDVDKSKLVDGVTYRATAWVRAPEAEAGPPPLDGAYINLSFYTVDGTQIGTEAESGPLALDGTWREITVTRAWDATADKLIMSVQARRLGGCFLVDDASLVRSSP